MISAMRVVLAMAALLVIYIDPAEPDRLVVPTYLALAGYALYSVLVFFLSVRLGQVIPLQALHWIDVAWYLLLIALSNGTNSIFFFFFFFAILVASFGWGFGAGLQVTLVSTVLFVIVGYFSAPQAPLQVNRLLLRPIELLVLGYLIAFWGGLQSRLKERLRLLKKVSLVSNPRFGIERTIQSVLESMRSSYDADSCMLILQNSQVGEVKLYGYTEGASYNLYRADRDDPEHGTQRREISEETARSLLPPSREAVIYRKGRGNEIELYDTKTGVSTSGNSEMFAFLNAFDGKSCFSIPVEYRGQSGGRLYLSGGKNRFDYADVEFVSQIMEQVTGVLENIRLVDSLASDAAGQERRKIAQDIHDSVIQPYIGLKFGLAAVKHKLENGQDVRANVEELLALTDGEIDDLRNYVGGLRRGETPQDIFLPAVRRFASKFSEATGLLVEVNGSDDLPIYDRLAAELFRMIEESLSNVRRHSTSSYAKLDIAISDGHLEMKVRNERLKRLGSPSFTPRSIADRATALGGETIVYTDTNDDTVVAVRIPL
jgi:signal transduction histidine kinase